MSGRTEHLVWYAAYGSNCAPDRFRAYLAGGAVAGAEEDHHGARDSRPPRDSAPVRFDRQIVFAGMSRRWGGGYAFLGHQRVRTGALGRRYLITAEQFDDVLAQENRREPAPTPIHDLPVGEITPTGTGAYDAVVALEPVDGVPVVTFTATDPPEHREPTPPTAPYLATILRGLTEVHDEPLDSLVDRLLAAPGVAPTWTAEAVAALVDDPDRPRNRPIGPCPPQPALPTLGSGGSGDVPAE